MTHKPRTMMSIAINFNRIGFCFFIGKQPMYWELSFKAAETEADAALQIEKWISFYQPDIVLTETDATMRRKGERSRLLSLVVKLSVDALDVVHKQVPRVQPYRSLYDQIDVLCERYPQMKAAQPERRKHYQKEPPYVTIFDALVMADKMNS